MAIFVHGFDTLQGIENDSAHAHWRHHNSSLERASRTGHVILACRCVRHSVSRYLSTVSRYSLYCTEPRGTPHQK